METSAILRLPLDVLIDVLGRLSPMDVLRVRQACKHLGEISFNRAIWADVLRGAMCRHGIWPLTYPVAKLEQPLLEHLALSPRKFLRKLQAGDKRPSKSIRPCSAQFLIYDPTPEEMTTLGLREVLQFQFMELLPGGRFLVTARLGHGIDPQNNAINVIQLWDLGIPPLGRQPRLLGTYVGKNTEQSSVDWGQDNFLLSRSEDDSHFLMVVCRRRTFVASGAVDSLIIVLQLRPFDPVPISSFLVETFLGVRLRSCRFTGQYFVAAMHNGSILLFAIESHGTSLVAKWKSTAKKTPKIHHCADRIFLLDSERLAQWSIPEMETVDTPVISHPDHPNHLPICTFADLLPKLNGSHPPTEPLRMMSVNTHSGRRYPDIPYYMAFFQDDEAALYRLESQTLPTKSVSPNFTPILIGRYSETYNFNWTSVSAARACDEHLVFTSWSQPSETNPHIHMHIIPTTPFVQPVANVPVEWQLSAAVRRCKVCPATGRICFQTTDEKIIILDCLEAPVDSSFV